MPTEHVLIESGDRDDAENLSSLVGHPNLQDSVHPNHQFTHEGVSIGQDATVTVSGGKAFIGYHGAANGNQPLQTSTGEDRREGLFVVEKASNEAVDLAQVDGENYLWLDAQIGTGDSPQWVMTDSNTQPAEGSLLIAKYLATDEDGDSVVEDIQHIEYYNRGPDLVADSISGGTDEEISLDESSLIDAGHDAVDVPQTVERTVADFEGGTLPQDAAGDTGNASVQSNVALEGDYSLEVDPSGSNAFVSFRDSRSTLPQLGDTFDTQHYITTSNVISSFAWSVVELNTRWIDATAIVVRFRGDNNGLIVKQKINGTTVDVQSKTVDFSNYTNESLTVTHSVGSDRFYQVVLYDSNDTEVATISTTIDDRLPRGGGIQYRTNSTHYWDGPFIERRETQARTNTQKGTTQLGNEVVPSGEIKTGPTTSSTNAERAIYQDAPVDTNVTQGTESKLTLLQSGLHPAMYMERTLDGQGGAYGHQLQAPLGRFARLNANLSWEYEDFSSVPHWNSFEFAEATTTITVTDRPRKVDLVMEATGNGNFGIETPILTTYESLDAFRVTFHDVSFSDNSGSNMFGVGIGSDVPVDTGGTNVMFTLIEGINLFTNTNGNLVTRPDGSSGLKEILDYNYDWNEAIDITIDYTGSEFRIFIDGDLTHTDNYSTNADFTPYIAGYMNSNTDETASVQQVTVEPLPEVLQ